MVSTDEFLFQGLSQTMSVDLVFVYNNLKFTCRSDEMKERKLGSSCRMKYKNIVTICRVLTSNNLLSRFYSNLVRH